MRLEQLGLNMKAFAYKLKLLLLFLLSCQDDAYIS